MPPVNANAALLLALVAAGLSAALHLRAEYRGPRWQTYLFKPATTTILLVLAAASTSAHGSRYQLAIVVGLAFSLLGDILLMLPRERFVAGLASFLVAHIAYAAAFTAGSAPGLASLLLLLPLLGAALPVLRRLWPGLGRLRVPVLFYAATIVIMVGLAWARAWGVPSTGAALAAVGAMLFMVSDTVLAFNRFQRPFHSAQAWVMSSYVAAQALIACSVGLA